jgi:hypothetical protein
MKWHEIRKQYPEQFVLVEALKAYSRDHKRYIDDMTVVGCYEDTKKAWEDYKKYRLETPTREFYILHTSKEKIEVLEQPFIRVRGVI